MKQLIQDLKKGQTLLEEVPAPQLKAGAELINTTLAWFRGEPKVYWSNSER